MTRPLPLPDVLEFMSEAAWRSEIGHRLRDRREARGLALFASRQSGIGYRVVSRLETARNVKVGLDQLYMLGQFYGCGLAGLVDVQDDTAGSWPSDAPSWPDTDLHVRRALRRAHLDGELGAKRIARRIPSLAPSWLFRVESGQYLTLDVVRLSRLAELLGTPFHTWLPEPFHPPTHDVRGR